MDQLALFNKTMNVPIILMGFGLPDDNLHAPNENYSLDQFFSGIRTIASFLLRMGDL